MLNVKPLGTGRKVVVIANKKGGTSKSTLTQVLAQVLAHNGETVTVIDADPNLPQVHWSKGNSKSGINVVSTYTDPETGKVERVGEDNIIGAISSIKQGYIFVDLEGVGSLMTSRSILMSDLVVIPFQASELDTKEAGSTIRLVKNEEQILKRHIPYKIILTRTNPAIRSKIEKMIMESLTERKYPVLTNQLNERSAFKSIFVEKVSLYEMDSAKVNGIDKAIQNAESIVSEIFS